MDRQEKGERYLSTAMWWKGLRETNNEAFLPLFFDQHRYLVLKGGGGSGKSIFVGRKVLERVTSEPGHRWLVTRKVARTLRDSCFAQLRGQIAEHYPDAGAKINKGDLWIGFPNGSEILFAGLDDVEKLKSIYDITGIWIEEASELEEGDFNQLDIRLRTVFPYYLQMILSFNPISITHWLKKRFFDMPDPRARVHESTYRDNRFLTDEAVKTLDGQDRVRRKGGQRAPDADPETGGPGRLRLRRSGGWRPHREHPVGGRCARPCEGLQEAGAGAALRHRRGHRGRRQ